jgi:WhiB family redox-sensing transcriptional regulator
MAGRIRESFEALCGTPSGYYRHRDHHEDACDACKDGLKRYRRNLRASDTPPPVDPMSELIAPDIDDRTARPAPGDWVDEAACRDKPAEWWFSERQDVAAIGKAICHTCPVELACLQHAVRVGEPHGIWGGKSERARRRIRANATRGAA